MQTRLIRLRFRRRIRKSKQNVEGLGVQAEQHIERHLLKKFDRIIPIKRFIGAWLGLLFLLIGCLIAQNLALSGYYQTVKTVPGGIFNEGVIGRFTNSNPLFATSDADTTVSKLIFAGLMTYDSQGKLIGDLASDFSVDASGSTYTVHLKPGLKWHDGKPLTSADVVFTYKLIQNPDVQSPLQASWQGIDVAAPDARTVTFKLPGGLAAFPHGMTNGIVPKHLLQGLSPVDLRSAEFNTVRPVGAGPFVWQAIEIKGSSDPLSAQQQIALEPFKDYHAGEPKLQKFIVNIFVDKEQLINAFQDKQLTAAEGLTEKPESLKDKDDVIEYNLPLRAATMVFFKTPEGVLADQKVRQALVRAADVPEIVSGLDYETRALRSPFMPGQVGYDRTVLQPAHDPKAARELLDAAGWKADKNGQRTKDAKRLEFTLTTADTPEYRKVTRQLKQQWDEVGVRLNIRVMGQDNFQNALKDHDYEAILYGISIGADPDVFVYWDSTQADIRATNRLNLSEYNNPTSDNALEAGRTRNDPLIRSVKYKPFLQAWVQDSPALSLYQPRALYLANGQVSGLEMAPVNTVTDRFNNVHNWQIRTAKVTNGQQ